MNNILSWAVVYTVILVFNLWDNAGKSLFLKLGCICHECESTKVISAHHVCRTPSLFGRIVHQQSYCSKRQSLWRHIDLVIFELVSSKMSIKTCKTTRHPWILRFDTNETELIILRMALLFCFSSGVQLDVLLPCIESLSNRIHLYETFSETHPSNKNYGSKAIKPKNGWNLDNIGCGSNLSLNFFLQAFPFSLLTSFSETLRLKLVAFFAELINFCLLFCSNFANLHFWKHLA